MHPVRQSHRIYRAELRLIAVAVLLLPWLQGCASSHSAEDAPPGIDFSGHWQLISAPSEDAQAKLDDAIEQMRRNRQRQLRNRGSEREGPFGDLPMIAPFPAPALVRKQLEQVALPPPSMEIKQTADAVLFTFADARSSRRLRPGAVNAISFLEYDTANVTCGWSGRRFVIFTRAPDLVTIEERYELADSGRHLKATINLAGPLVKPIELHAVYERVP
jgi:hypothetical protein